MLLIAIAILVASLPLNAEESTRASLAGRWLLDVEASTPAKDLLKGIRVSKKKKHRDESSSRQRGPGSSTQQRYWQEANLGREWQHSKELVHAGPLQRLIESENLEIVADEATFLFIYADGFERAVVPNPGGRVFTARGDELVKTEIGHSLAFWREGDLSIETRLKKGGQLIERLSTSDDGKRLTLNIEIDRRDWKWVAKLERVFTRVP